MIEENMYELLEDVIKLCSALLAKKDAQINPPVCLEDDEAEMLPLFEKDVGIDYLDEIPF